MTHPSGGYRPGLGDGLTMFHAGAVVFAGLLCRGYTCITNKGRSQSHLIDRKAHTEAEEPGLLLL